MSYYLLGMKVDPTSYSESTQQIITWAKGGESRTIFAANTHLVVESYDSPELRAAVNSSDLTTPDGMPLVWWLRDQGVKDQQRVYGPDLMLHVCQLAASEKIPIGLLGSTQNVLVALVDHLLLRFPDLQIRYTYSPPFRPLTPEEDETMIQEIYASGVRILFVGLGCPKQELWIAEHKEKVKAVMIGVGAAFQFHAGVVRQAPEWMQRNGLEWIFRLAQEPRRLWKRYFVVVPRYIYLVIMDKLGIKQVH